ncbi:MAG: thiol peroxidase [Laribacter sp.]|nr:thiol peroxidase [Laribacter sp.]MBP9526769.1 thiol peroxidase [Laribacter sp.]MBP9609499.1 thiol peroxidase [Laribacter sp.]
MQFHRLQCRQDNVQVLGDLPQPGQSLPGFMLVDRQFNDVSLAAFTGRPVAVMTVLSLELEDSRRLACRFAERPWPPQVCRLLVSSDLPLAQSRHLVEMGLDNLVPLSTLRGRDFHPTWGVLVVEHPFAGLTAPALVLADAGHRVWHAERLWETEGDFDWQALNEWPRERA